MAFYQLPPVGNAVCLSRVDEPEILIQAFGGYQSHYFASGTAALAAAITAAIQLKAADSPEVLLPAYGCPDLISAALFAGAKPVLVDFEADRPWMDMEALQAKISTQTVAIIAVDLFGISERLSQLRILAERAGVILIEDSAQAFPGGRESDIWQGDMVVLSFGRGKPVSLLGGGAVLVRNEKQNNDGLGRFLPAPPRQFDDGIQQRLTFRLKASLYNSLISPGLYWLPQSLPFLHLGETHFRPLTSIEGIDKTRLSMLPSNVKAYRESPMDVQKNLAAMLDELALEECDFIDLPEICQVSEDRRLLRYPLLVEPEARGPLLLDLQRQGLGPSCMYPSVLPEIPGLEWLRVSQNEFPAAVSFAKRLLTLPTHSQVLRKDTGKMHKVLSGGVCKTRVS